MANKTFDELSAASALTGDEILPLDQSGTTKRTTTQEIADLADPTDATARATADAALPKAGGTMTGNIVLAGAPSAGLHPATKTYADAGDATNAAAIAAEAGTRAANDSALVTSINTRVPTSRTVTGANSVSGGGALSANQTLELVNDTGAPGALKVYGTDGDGVRGWKDDPARRFLVRLGPYIGIAVDEGSFGGYTPTENVLILGIELDGQVPPTGANLTTDLTVAGAEQTKIGTLAAGAIYQRTIFSSALAVAAGSLVKVKFKTIGSTEPGQHVGANLICQLA